MTRMSIALAVAGLTLVAAAAPAAAQEYSKLQYSNPQSSDPQFSNPPVTTGSVGASNYNNYNNFNDGSEQKVSTYRKIASEAALLRYRVALRLTAAQEKYWPAAAAALRALSRQNELNETVVKRYAPAVKPLIASLNDEQRQVAMGLAAQAGLSQYAALF